jgi:hypothetical protein
MGLLETDSRQQGLKFKVNQRIFRAGTPGAAVRGGRGPDGRRQRPDSQRSPARTASELANIFVLAIRAGLPAGGTEEDCVRVSYTDIQPAVVALEQLLFYRTESGRAPSDPDPLDFVTARALSPLIHHPDFIVALLRACRR